MKARITAIATVVALAIPAAAGAASPGQMLTEPVSVEYPNMALKADSNEVAVEGVIVPAKPSRVLDVDGVI
jgi:hypothetical protein